ncbi:MAG: hypothetical protein OEW27_10435 [Aquincola sp.]|nr:hypothetical protein [Aquincola sp.]MDH5330355.1 hypothetical protein [Aquincola sp.]
MKHIALIVRGMVFWLALLPFGQALAEISITLNNSFIEKYKNRATIDAKFIVDHSKGKPNPASKDGDMHVAGRDAKNIGMAAVAEIMNAKNHPDAVEAANNAAGTNSPISISGAWRIWNEHGGDNVFVQGKPIAAAQSSNPDHVFEIHPVTEIGGIDIRASFQPIPGYDAKKPEDAFPRYENVRSKIIPKSGKVTIVSNGIGYNYVNFQMVLNEKPFKISDGAVAKARIQDQEGHLLLRNKRMVFVKDTPPEVAVRDGKGGDCLRVLGIPRLDLALVAWRVKNRGDEREPLNWNLPYEIIVVGVYPEPCEED